MLRRPPVVVANEIRLKRQLHAGAFLIVEGRDDRLFCQQFTCPDECNIVVANGRESVREVVQILDEAVFRGVLGIVDADFDALNGIEEEVGPNVIRVGARDLESLLLRSSALDRVLVEFGSQQKIEDLGGDVLALLTAAALPLGHLRLLSRREELGLRFRGLRFGAMIDRRTLEPNVPEMIQGVLNVSQRADLDRADLQARIEVLADRARDPYLVCSGEDLVEILSFGLRSAIGTNHANDVKPEVIRLALRLAYGEGEFANSELSNAIHAWENANPPFRILA